MRSLKILFVLAVFICIAANTANAQADVLKDRNWTYLGYTSYDSHEVTTPDGKFNVRLNFTFDLDDPMILEAIALGEAYSTDVNCWSPFGMFIATATFYPNGRVKIIGHYEP